MKHTITFILLLVLILSIGYYGAGLSELTARNSEDRSIEVSREDVNFNAVLFSGSGSGFDPMRLIEPDEAPVKDRKYQIRTDISAAIAAVFSRYDPKNRYVKGVDIPIEEAMQISRNNYIYTSGYLYLNPAGEKRSMDCIISADSFSIVYIRFRSPEVTEQDSIKAKSSLDRFDMLYNSFSSQNEAIEKGNASVWEKLMDYMTDEEFFAATSVTYTGFDSVYAAYDNLYSIIEPSLSSFDQLTKFWVNSVILNFISFRTDSGYDKFDQGEGESIADVPYPDNTMFVTGTSDTTEMLSIIPPTSEPEYTVFGDSIFQTVNYRQNKLITIYSITDDCIEGFYAYGL